MELFLSLALLQGLLGQIQLPPSGDVDQAAARLETMKQSVAVYDVRSSEGRGAVYRLKTEPVLRFTNTMGDTRDGALFLWLGTAGRPVAAAQVSARRDGKQFHELSSLSPSSLVAESATAAPWQPSRGGAEFQAVPAAPAPARTAEQRARQLRALAEEFAVEDEFHNRSWQRLRMLSKPLATYGKSDSEVMDGALFGFVMTTDPEVLLLLEARAGEGGPEWQYAFAPMTAYPVRASFQGRQVWSLPDRYLRARDNPREPFHVREVRLGQ